MALFSVGLDLARGRTARAIDVYFDERERPTSSREEQALSASLVGRFSAVLMALNLVGWLMLGAMLLLLGNTVAISTRERSRSYALLRALGFSAWHLVGLVTGEAVALALAGAALAVLISTPVARCLLAPFVQKEMGLSALGVSAADAVIAPLLAATVAIFAAALPALRLNRLSVAQALRRA